MRIAALLLLAAGCAAAPPRPDPEPPGTLRLQLRRGPGAPPCDAIGGGLEGCPVAASGRSVRFLTPAELGGEALPSGVSAADHARLRARAELARSLSEATLEWAGDDDRSHVVGRITCPGDEAFDAARLLILHTITEQLMDELGLEYLAVIPDTRMLLVFREDDPAALAMARILAARGGGGDPLAPGVLFVVNPDGVRARPW